MASFYFRCQANFFLDFLDYLKLPLLKIEMDLFHFFEKQLFRLKNDEEKTNRVVFFFKNDRLKKLLLKNYSFFVLKSYKCVVRFQKRFFFLMTSNHF